MHHSKMLNNHREDDFSGRTPKNDILPRIRPIAAMRRHEWLVNEVTNFGDLLLVVEHEFNRQRIASR